MAGNRHFGWLSLFGNSVADAGLLLRLTAAVIGVELARDALRGRKDGFWETLLSGALHDVAAIREEAAARGIVLAASYVAVALEGEIAGDQPRPANASELRALASEAFRSADVELGLHEHGATLLVFVPAARSVDASNAKTAATLLPKSAARRKPALRVSGGVGGVAPLSSLRRSVDAARAALSIGRRVHGNGHVVAYDDLGAYCVIYEGADVQRLRDFASEALAPLRLYDEKHQTELEKTLKTYFHEGQNVKTAAAALNVHRHTVFYRLRQIAEICSRSLESPHDQLTLRLAVAIDELHSAS